MLLYQPEDSYCYNSDTIFLYDFISSFKPKGELLDIGSGCGVLGLLISRDFKKVNLNQSELQARFQFYSRKNSELNGVDSTLYSGDFLEIEFDKKFDFIVSNPPFWDSNVIQTEHIEKNIARYSHHLPIDNFFKKVDYILKPRGYFIFCYDAKQFQRVSIALSKFKLNIERVRFIYPKQNKSATLALIQVRKNSKSLMKIAPPLFVFDGENFSKEVEFIYKKAKTHSIKSRFDLSKS